MSFETNEPPIDAHQADSVEPASGGRATVIKFGPFILDRASGVLLRDSADVHVPPKAMDVLLCLLERPGAVVSKEDLMSRVWAGTAVTDASLSETVRTLRNALGDDPRLPTYVQTVHRRGYRFVAVIQPDGDKIPSAGVSPAEGNPPPAGLAASAVTHLILGRRKHLGILAVFIIGGIIGVWGVSLLGSQDRPTLAPAASPTQTAKLWVGAVGISDPVFRYDVGLTGTPTLDLTLTHPTFALPGFFAFSPAGEMLVMNNDGGVSRFLDPRGTPVFNGSIDPGNFSSPHWATFRGDELFIGQSEGDVLRFVFDSAGVAMPNGAITGRTGVVQVNPATGELFVCCRDFPVSGIARLTFDASGNTVPNGSIKAVELNTPHDMAFSPWGELFVANGYGNNILRFVFDAAGNASANGLIAESSLSVPLGVDFSPWGELFVANRNDGLIHRWVFDASFNAIFNGSFLHPYGIHDLQFAPSGLQVEIDIKPGSDPNSITVGSNGKVPVAIFSSPDFDATTVDPLTVALASGEVWLEGNGTAMASYSDVDGDGLTDIVVHVATNSSLLTNTDANAVLMGETFDGIAFTGTDAIRIVRQD